MRMLRTIVVLSLVSTLSALAIEKTESVPQLVKMSSFRSGDAVQVELHFRAPESPFTHGWETFIDLHSATLVFPNAEIPLRRARISRIADICFKFKIPAKLAAIAEVELIYHKTGGPNYKPLDPPQVSKIRVNIPEATKPKANKAAHANPLPAPS
jgi:hypothetical protein